MSLVEEAVADPHTAYARLAREGDVVHDEPSGSWFVLSAELVRRLSRDPRLRARGVPAAVSEMSPGSPIIEVEHFLGRWLVFSDPPLQSRVRRALAPCLARPAVAARLVGLADVARTLATDLAAQGGDLVADLAVPLSRRTTAAILEATPEEMSELEESSAALIDYLSTPGFDEPAAARAVHAIARLRAVFEDGMVPRGGQVARALSDAAAIEAGIGPEDAVAACAQLLTGAMEPLTTALVVASLLAQALPAAAADDPPTIRALVEEALSTEPPFHFAPRVAAADFEVGGQSVSAGDRVVLNLLAANADLRGRCPAGAVPDHLSFGSGTHFCLGAAATRLHLESVLPAVIGTGVARRIDLSEVGRRPAFGATAFAHVPVRGGAAR
ncbi:cytochrome P450 [Humibacillus xanthopallidus]|uniref:Cytochrome P450 n=1 Tax=Humibacillus xanthopallidus TaxID=412689 RepID=A0A543PKF5_9MICO|nr:cytochrome P450 [Humibacillus xanthopallidus]TQN44557.1 cytochrome P450 [Humibacillus xanthopallidus]